MQDKPKLAGYIGLEFIKTFYERLDHSDSSAPVRYDDGDGIFVPIYEESGIGKVYNERSVGYIKQMLNLGICKYADDETMELCGCEKTETPLLWREGATMNNNSQHNNSLVVVALAVVVACLVAVGLWLASYKSTTRISDEAAECASLGGIYSNESGSCYYAGNKSDAASIRQAVGL